MEQTDDADMSCEIPIRSSSGDTAYFDLARSVPGAILTPQLSDDEVWAPGSVQEIQWLYYKGEAATAPQSGHVLDAPFKRDTSFKLDLLRSDSSILRNVMPATTIHPFQHSTKLGAIVHGVHNSEYTSLANASCPTNAYRKLSYKWTVPADLDTEPVYHLQLSTNDSEAIHFSGAFRVGSGCQGMNMGHGAKGDLFVLVGVAAVGVLVAGHFLAKWKGKRANYEEVDGEEDWLVGMEKTSNLREKDETA